MLLAHEWTLREEDLTRPPRRPYHRHTCSSSPGGASHEGHATRVAQRGGGARRRRDGARGPAAGRAGPDHAEAGAGHRPGRRHLEVRPALQHELQRDPRLLQPLRQPDQPSPGRQAVSRARHRVEAPEPDDVDVQAPPGRQVPQRRPVHLGRRQVEHRAHLRSRRQDHGGHRAHHHRPDRGAGPLHAGRPHQEAGPAPARAARLLRRADRAEEVRRSPSATRRSMPSPSARDRSASCPG